MPRESRRPYKRLREGEPYRYTVEQPQCLSLAKFTIPGGPVVTVQCTRIAQHRGETGGHWCTLDLLDGDGRIIRKPDGIPLRISLKWRGTTNGVGVRPEVRYIAYDPKKHGTMQDGTFDYKAYLDGTLE